MAAESSRSSTSSADTYIGSLISLTSKSEIRYEGILYNINTEESSIGLRNVRSFGSEGRKKDGPQIMPSDKVYEYILFRGSDIKDLQVKTSPPVQPAQPLNSDPAIIQSHYPRPTLTPSTLPPTATGNSFPSQTTPNPQLGQQHPGMPLYQPDGSMGPWGPPPPPPNSNGLPMPMYWPGFYPQLHQQSMFRPMQYPNLNAPTNLPEYPSPLLPTSSSSANSSATSFATSFASSANPISTSLLGSMSTLPSSLPPVPPLVLNNEPLPNFLQTKPHNPVVTPTITTTTTTTTTTITADVSVTIPPISSIYQGVSHTSSSSRTTAVPNESSTPSLVTPGQLLQSGKDAVVSPSSSSQVDHKDVELAPLLEQSAPVAVAVSVSTEVQSPILPLPSQARNAPKTNGAPYHNHHNYRGRERGRGGSTGSRPVMKFTEEFDFTAMNEKFNKDEVWGSLGKTNKPGSNDSDEDELQHENYPAIPKLDVKAVYSKDDFFDTLSCNSNDHQLNNGRTRFSEQMKLDTETFGEFSRYRGGRGGRGPYRGGRSRGGGGYYHGRGYGYVNRGRGGTRGY